MRTKHSKAITKTIWIACSAKRNDVDVIVTRNKRDFAKSPVPALTPEEFVSAYKPVDMEYELVEF